MKQVLHYIEICEAEGIQTKDICIASKTRALYKDIQDELYRNDIKYCEVKNGDRKGDKDGISFSTFHSLKGLEFRVVMLVGVTERSMPSIVSSNYPFMKTSIIEILFILISSLSLLRLFCFYYIINTLIGLVIKKTFKLFRHIQCKSKHH